MSDRTASRLVPPGSSCGAAKWPDQIIMGILLALVAVPPFLVGGVYPWAFAGIECVILAALVLWMSQVISGRMELPHLAPWQPLRATLPITLFGLVIALQLVPLPPGVLRVMSPATYSIYSHSLPGWPRQSPYSQAAISAARGERPPSELNLVTKENRAGVNSVRPSRAGIWRTISLAPSRTREAALKMAAMAALLAIVTFYPFASLNFDEGNQWLARRLVAGMLATGLMLAAVGLLERETWNGKLLWLITPYGDLAASGGALRARGPFVDPDHFAGYLGMIMPLAVIVTLWPAIVAQARSVYGRRLFSGFTSAVIAAAILMSMSRAALAGMLVSMIVMLLVLFKSKMLAHRVTAGSSRKILFPLLAAAVLAVFGAALAGIISSGIVPLRWPAHAGSSEVSRDSRLEAWRDTLGLVRAFPALGAGLGCFAEIFPHYQRPPWSPVVWDTAHDDYLQLAAETGLSGILMLVAGSLSIGHKVWESLPRLPRKHILLLAGLAGGVSVALFHETVDFPLEIPANASLFAIMAGTMLRMTMCGGAPRITDRWTNQVLACGVAGIAILLMVMAGRQGWVPFPYSVTPPLNPEEARQLILDYPARAETHLLLIKAGGDELAMAGKLDESEIAVWLDPTNPSANDIETGLLLQSGKTADGLEALKHSVWMAPGMNYHSYLQTRAAIEATSSSVGSAIGAGFDRAVAGNYTGAVAGYGNFLDALGRYADEAALYSAAADKEARSNRKLSLEIQAGGAYAAAGLLSSAEDAFKRASAADPADAQPYIQLCRVIYAPRRQCRRAQEVIDRGLAAGASPFPLYEAVADVYEQAGHDDQAIAGLQKALHYKPSDAAANASLGRLYLKQGNTDKAIEALRSAAQTEPGSGARWFVLAQAEERDYQYFAALRDYSQAATLKPQDNSYGLAYESLKQRIAIAAPARGEADGR